MNNAVGGVPDTEKIRRPMTDARKRRIHADRGGTCRECREPVPVLGPEVRYDHRPPIWISGRDIDEDVWPVHTTCDAPITAADKTEIAKIKRVEAKRLGTFRPPKRRVRENGMGQPRWFRKSKVSRLGKRALERKKS